MVRPSGSQQAPVGHVAPGYAIRSSRLSGIEPTPLLVLAPQGDCVTFPERLLPCRPRFYRHVCGTRVSVASARATSARSALLGVWSTRGRNAFGLRVGRHSADWIAPRSPSRPRTGQPPGLDLPRLSRDDMPLRNSDGTDDCHLAAPAGHAHSHRPILCIASAPPGCRVAGVGRFAHGATLYLRLPVSCYPSPSFSGLRLVASGR